MKYGTSNFDLEQKSSSFLEKKKFQNISKSEIFRIESSEGTQQNADLIKIKDFAEASKNSSLTDNMPHFSVVKKFLYSIKNLQNRKIFYIPQRHISKNIQDLTKSNNT